MFAKKTYRETRWMEKIMAVTLPEQFMKFWLSIAPQYAVDVYCADGWVEAEYIRMSKDPVCLQCQTGFGTIVLYPSEFEKIKVVYLKQFDPHVQ